MSTTTTTTASEVLEPCLRHVQCLDQSGLHRMAYWEWPAGPAGKCPARPSDAGGGWPARFTDADQRTADSSTSAESAKVSETDERKGRPVLVCAHGLSRQGRDFDVLARAMSDAYRVVCPDVVGRGESDRLADPAGYQLPTYVADMVTLLARLDAPVVHWLGTSMGGLIGIALAALPGSPIGKLVVNDIGPQIDPAGLARIASYVGAPLDWASEEEAAGYLWSISQGFGAHSQEQWLALTRPMLRRDGERFRLHYDPAIALPFRAATPAMAAAGEAAMWTAYDRIACPTLVVRGAGSDILSRATAEAMAARGPRARIHELPGVGHAPTLVFPEQIAVVRDFLLAGG